MAYPTQITIASGTTVYEGDNNDGITSRQVQVSVTYQLERQDVDLLHVTAVKAREVDAAQEVVWHHIWEDRAVRGGQAEMGLPPRPPGDEDDPLGGQGDPDDGPDDGGMDDVPPFHVGGEGHGKGHGDGATPPPHHAAVPAEGVHACRTGPARAPGNGHAGGSPPDQPERVEPWISKPQKLAVAAQARRLGLSDVALAEMIRERFGKESFSPHFAVDRLTKAEGDALLRALRALGHDERAPRPPHPLPA